MTKSLKVYGWTGSRNESRGPGNHHGQTREIVAASSAAEVMRLTGMTRTAWTHSGSESGNTQEIDVALSQPGVIFWSPLYPMSPTCEGWTRADSGVA